MSRQIVSYSSVLVVAVTALVVLGFLWSPSVAQDGFLSAPRVVNAEIINTWQDKGQPVAQVTFDRAMDAPSVADALVVEPSVLLDLSWERGILYVEPRESLAPDTEYRFTLGMTATDVEGIPLAQTYRWGYVTQNPIASVVQPVRTGTRSMPLVLQFTTSNSQFCLPNLGY